MRFRVLKIEYDAVDRAWHAYGDGELFTFTIEYLFPPHIATRDD